MSELWSDDFEVMHWVIERFERTGPRIEVGEVLRVFPEEQYDRMMDSVRRMSGQSYVVSIDESGLRHAIGAVSPVRGVTDPPLHMVGLMPEDAEALADRLLAELAEGSVSEPDPERRFKFEAGLRGVGALTRDLLVDVVAAAMARIHNAPQAWSRPYEPIAHGHASS
ncbi:MAG TPA: hypothetical protein VFO16_17960 [Pseudonocardiaceae bacterium]|nr:hypothetical protein [Pseudonocardiaceae bacterium]